MAKIFYNWYEENEERKYPLDDNAGMALADVRISESFLADLHISAPNTVGELYISSASITPSLVSFTIMGDIPVAAISIVQPVTPHRTYNLEPLTAGVAGWVSFGEYVRTVRDTQVASHLTFTDTEGKLNPKIVYLYDPLPVTSLGVTGFVNKLVGDLKLVAGADLVVEEITVTVNDTEHRAIVIRLDGSLNDQKTFTKYTGDCGKRPEEFTCPEEPVRTINGVSPDCNGNINIEIVGSLPNGYLYDDNDNVLGIIFEYPYGYVDICGGSEKKLNLPYTPEDICEE